MKPAHLVVGLALVAGLAGCAASPEHHDAYYRDGYHSYRYHDHDADRHGYYGYSYNRWDPYDIDSHRTN